MFAGTGRIGVVHEAGVGKSCPSQILLQIISNFIFYVQYLQVMLFILD